MKPFLLKLWGHYVRLTARWPSIGSIAPFIPLIAAEMIATNVGLGYMLFVARDFYRTEVIVFGMIVIGGLWLLIDRLLLAPLERATIERWGMVRAA